MTASFTLRTLTAAGRTLFICDTCGAAAEGSFERFVVPDWGDPARHAAELVRSSHMPIGWSASPPVHRCPRCK